MNNKEIQELFRRYEELDRQYLGLLSAYNQKTKSNRTISDLQNLHNAGLNVFTEFENCVANLSAPGIVVSKEYIQDLILSTTNLVETLTRHWRLVDKECQRYGVKQYNRATEAYRTIQRFLKTYNQKKLPDLCEKFTKANLPVVGFTEKGKHKLNTSNTSTNWINIIIGIILVFVSGLLIYLTSTDNWMKYLFLKTTLSLGGGLVFSGTLQDKIKVDIKMKGLVVTAFGAAAIFILLYFFNPAEMKTLPVQTQSSKFEHPSVTK